MDGGYLSMQIRQWIIRPIIAFREYIFSDVLPAFSNLDQRANKIADEYFEGMGAQPADEDFDGDMSGYAEEARDQGQSWYDMMKSLRQTMLNLLAAGLFHLVEQQLGALCRDAGFLNKPLKETKLEVLTKWYKAHTGVEFETMPSWALIDELRYVANTVKHGEGPSARTLKSLRPELFRDPTFATIVNELGLSPFETRRVEAPLAGEDLFVTEELLRKYAEGSESFFREIAAYFDAHEDEYY